MKLENLEIYYDGLSKVLNSFAKLYEVANNKEIVDEALKKFTNASIGFDIYSGDCIAGMSKEVDNNIIW